MTTWITAAQYTPEWYAARLGCLTASRMAEAFDYTKKGEEGAKRRKLRLDLMSEVLTGQAEPIFVNAAMRWGTETEPQAREAYEEVTGQQVMQCGFALSKAIPYFGASPDGLVDHDGLLEIKCPVSSTHIQYLIDDVVPEQYHPQMTAQCVVTGRRWVDFVSFDPRFPQEYQLFIRRFTPSHSQLQDAEREARKLTAELQEMFTQIEKSAMSRSRRS